MKMTQHDYDAKFMTQLGPSFQAFGSRVAATPDEETEDNAKVKSKNKGMQSSVHVPGSTPHGTTSGGRTKIAQMQPSDMPPSMPAQKKSSKQQAADLPPGFLKNIKKRQAAAKNGNGQTNKWDPDNDGDDDSTPSGDTDHDHWTPSGKQKKSVPGKPLKNGNGNGK